MKQELRFCTAPDGVSLAYAISGSGPPMVRVANWLTHLDLDWNGPVWSHWFQAFSKDHTLVRFDLRGSGLSDRNVIDQSLDAWVSDLEAIVDDVGLERFPLLGFCQGGAIALAYAVRHPERVSHLILFDTYARESLVDGVPIHRKKETEALKGLIEVGWGRNTPAFRRIFSDLLMPEASAGERKWLAELQRKIATPEMAARLWRAIPEMTLGHLVFSIATTGYILIALQLEERDLIQVFGETYQQYLRKVPMFIPRPGRKVHLKDHEDIVAK